MTISLSVPELTELRPRITVFGVGGAGGNAVNNMIRSGLEGVEFVVANTDAQALTQSSCDRRIQMGVSITEGLGAGSKPEIGCAAAEESIEEILDHLSGCHMVFITAGMGGGTGTGAAPVIARAAKEQGILTVGVVTKPFQFEGNRRMRVAEEGISEFQRYADTLLVIPNQNLFRVANENTTFADAFSMADEVLHSGVRGITDLMVMPGLINLDFADVRAVMNEMGKAMMGTGEASGEKRAVEAAEAAIANPLLDDVSMKGARGVLINITGGPDLGLYEVDEAANRIRAEVDPDANIIVGSTFSDQLDGSMRVSVVATGIDAHEYMAGVPQDAEAEGMRPQWQAGLGLNPNSRPAVHVMTETIEKRMAPSRGGSKSPAQAEGEGEFVDPATGALKQSDFLAGSPTGGPAQPPAGVRQDDGVLSVNGGSAVPAGSSSAGAAAASRAAPDRPGEAAASVSHGPAARAPVPEGEDSSIVCGAADRDDSARPPGWLKSGPDAGEGGDDPAAGNGCVPADGPSRKRSPMTVFDKMMAGVRSARQANRSGMIPKRLGHTPPFSGQAPLPGEADPANDAAEKPSGSLFEAGEDDEQLEIPAFLRRAN